MLTSLPQDSEYFHTYLIYYSDCHSYSLDIPELTTVVCHSRCISTTSP